MKIFQKNELLKFDDYQILLKKIEEGFKSYSMGNVSMPPVCHMHFDKPIGDLHIKCAAEERGKFYAVKIASCFPENPSQGIPSINGMMMLFCQKTGTPIALFKDEGYLTHLRTALAGAAAAKALAPKNITNIGIIGAGAQARFQLRLLKEVTSCRSVIVWSRTPQETEKFVHDKSLVDFDIKAVSEACQVGKLCNLIVTTTPATSPILWAKDICPGTHITAVGSDRPGKQELDPQILGKSALVVVDSRTQCFNYGETFAAIQARCLDKSHVVELGEIIQNNSRERKTDAITVADLTGLGVQDLVIATAFYEYLQ